MALDSGASGCSDDSMGNMRMVKVQLASLTSMGLEKLLVLKSREQDLWEMMGEDPHPLSLILRTCTGYGRCLARWGTMWLNLGLWKHFLKAPYSPYDPTFKAVHDVFDIDRELSQA